MTTVPPPTTPSPQLLTAAPTAPVVTLLQASAAMTSLPPGAVLDAVVVPTPPASQNAMPGDSAKPVVTLRTPQGDVTMRLPAPLPPGTDVELQVVRANAQQVTVRILTVDDQPAQQVLAQLRQAAQPPQPPPVAAQPPPLQNPALVTTTLPPATAWTPAGAVPVTDLGVISGYVVEAADAAPLPSTPQAAAPIITPGAVPTLPVGLLQTNAAQLFSLITGGEVSLRVISVQMPDASVAAPDPTPGATPGAIPPSATPPAPPAAADGAAPAPQMPGAASQSPATPGLPPSDTGAGQSQVPPTVTQSTTAPQIVAQPPADPSDAPTFLGAVTDGDVTEDAADPLGATPPTLVIVGPQGLPAAPPAPPQIVQTPPPETTLMGTVVANKDAIPIIATAAGEIQLNARANLPIGTRVVIEIAAQAPPLPGALPSAPSPAAAVPLSGPAGAVAGWPTLTESLAVLQRADPQAALQLAAAIPDGGPRTAVALISFMQAMRSGDPRQWPGDPTLRALESAGPRGSHLASQLSDEVSTLSSRAREASTEWRSLPVPWNADGRVDRIALITRREDAGDEDGARKKSGGGTRFLINLDLSRLGSLQLDGMFRKESRGFDLMVRTKVPLPDDMRLDLTGLFASSNAAMGLKGGVSFQVVKKFPDPTAQNQPVGQDKSGLWA